jgi:hypothetical protein
MTQPAASSPARHQDEAGNVRASSSLVQQRNPRSRLWAAGIAVSGLPAGLLWWLLAPGGLNLVSGNAALASGANTQGWLARDLVLAGLFVFAGCLVAVLLSGRKDAGSSRTLLLSVGASGVAGVLAWQTGLLAGLWLGGPRDTSVSASVAFSLRSYTVLLLWPAAAACGYFAISVFELLHRPQEGQPSTGDRV